MKLKGENQDGIYFWNLNFLNLKSNINSANYQLTKFEIILCNITLYHFNSIIQSIWYQLNCIFMLIYKLVSLRIIISDKNP